MTGSSLPTNDPSADVVIEIRGVSKWFGDFQVLCEVDLTVWRGDRIVVCGPSGSGKSTLIRCINRLETHQTGTITVEGVRLSDDLKRIHKVRRNVGMVFQQFNLFPHLTVVENCMLGLVKARKLARVDAERRARLYLEKVRIADQAHKYPAELSGGQQQRAAIARTLCMEPRVLLFDEPTSALDPEMVQEVLEVMKRLADDGMTMICVTHEMGFAREVAHRIVFMDHGRILEQLPPHRFFTDPGHPRARQFLEQILS